MAITAAVTPGETYPDSTNVTRAMLRNGAAPAIAISGDIENADVADAAAIAFSKLETLANGSVIVGNATNVATECTVTDGSMAVSGNAVTITPSNATITYDKLAVGSSNIIKGAAVITSAASADHILVADSGASDALKAITLANLCNTGTVNVIAPEASFNMDVSFPVNSFAIAADSTLTPTGHPASGEYQTSILYITNGSGSDRTLALAAGSGPKAWSVLKYSSATPTFTIPDGESAVLSVMAFSGSQIGAYAATA